MLNETFARLAGTGLSVYLRTPVSMELASLEQTPYEEYIRDLRQSAFVLTSLSPLSGQAIFEVEFEILFTLIDRLLGGPGKHFERNVLTDIEKPLVQQVLNRIFAAFRTSWEGIVTLNPIVEHIETNRQFVQITPPNDIVIVILFEVKIGEVRGAMSVCVPYLVLKPIAAKLTTQKWFVSGNRRQNENHYKALVHQVNSTSIECTVELGKTKMKTRDFLSLRKGDLIRLNQSTQGFLTLLIGGVPKFLGKPALDDKKLVFHISHPISET
jgi:flagellar motor switch protein FliM